MKRQWFVRRLKISAVLIATALCFTMNSPVVYASDSDFDYEDDDSDSYEVIDHDFNDFFYSGAEITSNDPYHFDYSSMPKDYEYRVGDFYCQGTILLAYLGNETNVIIPEGITRLGREDVLMDSAFGGTSVVTVTFPSTLKDSGHHSFVNCQSLKTVNLNSGLEKIGSFCFFNSSIESITIPDSVQLVDSDAFCDATQLKEVIIKGKNVRFEESVFENTPFLKSLYNKDKVAIIDNYLLDAVGYKKRKFVVPGKVTSIAGGSFFLNNHVEEIVMHDNATILGSQAFRNCESLKKIKMSKKLKCIPYWAFVRSELEEITIPESVTTVESGAFYGLYSLEKVNFLSKTTDFEEGVFEDTAWLAAQQEKSPFVIINNVLIDATMTSGKVVVPNTVKIINDEAFAGNEEVTEIIIPDSVVRVDKNAFWSCYNLKSVDFGNSVKKIGESAFSCCNSLKSVVFPDSIEELGEFMFFNSNTVEEVRLPANLKRLEDNVLSETAITSVVIPSGVTYIGRDSMASCDKLDKFYISSELEEDSYILGGGSENLVIYYPQDAKFDWLTPYVGEIGNRIATPSYSLNYNTLTLYPTWYGKQLQLEDEFQRPVANSEVIWTSDNTKVATVTNGNVIAVGSGTATISAAYMNKTYTCTVTVKDPCLNKTKVTLTTDDNTFLYLLCAKTTDVKWTSSNKSIATVSQAGRIHAKKKGTATITATVGGKKYSCKVTVKN